MALKASVTGVDELIYKNIPYQNNFIVMFQID